MPKPPILKRLISQLEAKGQPPARAIPTATGALQKAGDLKRGSQTATAKGTQRGAMTPAARAKSRAVKARGGKTADYAYSSRTNSVKKK